MEEWRNIGGYIGAYQVSSTGNIRSLERLDSARHRLKGRDRKLKIDRDGYNTVALCKGGKHTHYGVHRLVALAFIDNPLNLSTVNHKDCNPLNNNMDNLEWCTTRYNTTYGNTKIKMAKSDGFKDRINRAKKKIYQYDLCHKLIKPWESMREAERHGYDRSSVSSCLKDNQRVYKGCRWDIK